MIAKQYFRLMFSIVSFFLSRWRGFFSPQKMENLDLMLGNGKGEEMEGKAIKRGKM